MWTKFQKPVSNTLNFIFKHILQQTRKITTCGKGSLKSYSEALLTIETPLLHTWFLLQQVCTLSLQAGQP